MHETYFYLFFPGKKNWTSRKPRIRSSFSLKKEAVLQKSEFFSAKYEQDLPVIPFFSNDTFLNQKSPSLTRDKHKKPTKKFPSILV